MRKSNWKMKLVMGAAFLLGLLAGLAASMALPVKYAAVRGLVMFGTMAAVSCLLVFAAVRIGKIGEE